MKVRLITPSGTRAVLRIYWGEGCPKYGCHDATKHLMDSNIVSDQNLGGDITDHKVPAKWATHCDNCGEQVPQGHFLNRGNYSEKLPQYQVFHRTIYDSGQDHPEPGDMWWVPWLVHDDGLGGLKSHHWDNETDSRGHLHIMLPDGHEWDIDSRASNCTMKDDRLHRCWVRHGEPPNVHVDKNGHTCNAGAGSILSHSGWHGFLHNGELIQ